MKVPSSPHPAVAVIAVRRITKRAIAKKLGYTEQWVGVQLLGHVPSSKPFRAGLSEMLGLTEEELFNDDAAQEAGAA